MVRGLIPNGATGLASHFGTSKKIHIPRDGSQLCGRFFEVEVALKGVQVGVFVLGTELGRLAGGNGL